MTNGYDPDTYYDPKCMELAKYFLEDDEPQEEMESLAVCIQKAVENWLYPLPIRRS